MLYKNIIAVNPKKSKKVKNASLQSSPPELGKLLKGGISEVGISAGDFNILVDSYIHISQ